MPDPDEGAAAGRAATDNETGAIGQGSPGAAGEPRAGEQRIRTILESITDGFFSLDRDWCFDYVNREAARLLGRQPGELLGKRLWDEYPGVLGSEFERGYRRAVAERVAVSFAAHYPDHDRWYDVRVYPAAAGLSVYFRDITVHQRAEDALRRSEQKLRALFESMDEGFCIVEMIFDAVGRPIDYRFEEVNPAFERHTGLRGVAGRSVREMGLELEAHWFERYGRVALTGEPVRFVNHAQALGNRCFDVQAFRLGGELSRQVAVLFNDVTDRVRAEEQLREADRQFRVLADNIPQLAWIADAGTDGQVHWFNKSWLEYTGATLESMRGSGWRAVHHPDHADRVIRKFAHHVREGLDWEDTFPLRGRDGQYRWFLSRMNVLRDDSGKVTRIFGTNTDITEQREMASRLQAQAAELSAADRRKDEFLAILAHELRNPLAPLRNALQILRLAGGRGDTVERARTVMERQLAQMVRLVDDLLDVSRISRDKLVLRKEALDLAAVLHSAVEASRPLIEAAGLRLTVSLPAEPIALHGDMTRLAQVFVNLLNNAAKFSERGGEVRLDVALREDDVVVRVADTGIGIAADHLPQVFEMFAQVSSALERSHGGLGIGLSLVRRLVEMHGGQVSAHSEGLGRGSEFTVCLPVAR